MGQKDTGKWGGGIRGGGGGKDVKQGKGKVSRIQKWKHGRPLYLELLKIAQQMVAGASWTNAPLSPFRPVESIGWRGGFPEPAANSCWGGDMERVERREEWSGAGTIFCTAWLNMVREVVRQDTGAARQNGAKTCFECFSSHKVLTV